MRFEADPHGALDASRASHSPIVAPQTARYGEIHAHGRKAYLYPELEPNVTVLTELKVIDETDFTPNPL